MERFDIRPSEMGECPALSEADMEMIGRFLAGEIDLSLIDTEDLTRLMIEGDIW
jgi:hypothetical protein